MDASELLTAQEPFALFDRWYSEVQKSAKLREPTAMELATASEDGQPSLRTVLLKSHSSSDGFVFYTNYESRKGRELTLNPKAALLFYWDPLFQQIRIQGAAAKVPRAESEAYWKTRPYDSQLAGWVSQQSRPVPGSLHTLFDEARKKWDGQEIPCPANWGGFALKPTSFEFWIGHKHRLHTSVRFERQAQGWVRQILFP